MTAIYIYHLLLYNVISNVLLYARYGASVFVSAVSLVQSFQRLPYNPQCFFVLESDSTLPPILWQQVGDINK